MAEVTVSSPPIVDVHGSTRTVFYCNQNGTAGSVSGPSGSTLTVPLTVVYKYAASTGTSITGFTIVAGTNGGKAVITLTTGGGAMTNEWIQVTGRP